MQRSEVFTAGESKPFMTPGRFFRLMRTFFPVDLEFRLRGQVIDTLNGVEGGAAIVIDGGYDNVVVTSPAAQTVSMFFADSRVQFDRITGDVSVVDGGAERTKANVAFVGAGFQPAVAAQFSHVQLWNPPGSGVRMIVSQVSAIDSAGSLVYLSYHNAALTNAYVNANPQSKLAGGAVSNGQNRIQGNAAILGTNLLMFQAPTTGKELRLTEPMVIPPGQGAHIASFTVNTGLTAFFEFSTEPV